jgi:tyrosyl-tRNA synthetase
LRAATSKREAREFITGRSVSLNGEVVTDVNMMVTGSNGLFNQYTVIRRGKKNYYLASHR